jgi:hypothetical protein
MEQGRNDLMKDFKTPLKSKDAKTEAGEVKE